MPVIAGEEAETLHRVEELDRPGSLFTGQFAARGRFAIATAARFHGDDIADDLQVLCRHLTAAIDEVEFQFLPFCETFETGTFDSADVNENVLTAAILLDEA